MKRCAVVLGAGLLAGVAPFATPCRAAVSFQAAGSSGSHSPLADSPKVELKTTIERVQILPGQGMPYLEIKEGQETVRVMLGSMRYLLEKNFNPKAGAVAIIKGFRVNKDIIARSIEIPSEKMTIQFREEDGTPLWRMGRSGTKK